MKKLLLLLCIVLYLINWYIFVYADDDCAEWFDNQIWKSDTENIYNKCLQTAINTKDTEDPLRAGTKKWVQAVEWIKDKAWSITDSSKASEDMVTYVSKWIKYFIWLLAIAITIMLIYHGIGIVTAAWEDKKMTKAMKGARNYTILIVLVWLVWLLVIFVFNVITSITDKS